MERVPEPEVMDGIEQARAYAQADFEAPHQMFVDLFRARFGRDVQAPVLDLGCGTADITTRFSRAYPDLVIHGVDASSTMLHFARLCIEKRGCRDKVTLIKGLIPWVVLPVTHYRCIIVNSLLHHLGNPMDLWGIIKRCAASSAPVFVMDLLRPSSSRAASRIVETYAAREPEVLRKDFYNSLLAAYTPEEVAQQIEQAGLADFFQIEVVSDRHLVVSGRMD